MEKRGMAVCVALSCLSFHLRAQEEALQVEAAITNDSVAMGFTERIPETEIGFDMVLVPKGTFLMGSPESETGRKPDEGPQKEVVLDSFYMGKYEITWEIFELFFKQNQQLFAKLDD